MEHATTVQMDSLAMESTVLTLMNVNKEGFIFLSNLILTRQINPKKASALKIQNVSITLVDSNVASASGDLQAIRQ